MEKRLCYAVIKVDCDDSKFFGCYDNINDAKDALLKAVREYFSPIKDDIKLHPKYYKCDNFDDFIKMRMNESGDFWIWEQLAYDKSEDIIFEVCEGYFYTKQ